MKINLPIRHSLGLLGLLLLTSASFSQNTPLSINGQLKLVGNQLSNECGNPIQLRGMSSHGLQWYYDCITSGSVSTLANGWGIDIIRAAMYVQEGGYVTNPSQFQSEVEQIASLAEQNGIYCIIDWHVLNPGDPNANISDAKTFFQLMAQKYAGKKHIIYEICNEPNGVTWSTVKTYADQIIPIIRQYDKENIIVVGTPQWSSKPGDVVSNPVSNPYNVMYTFHFYAGTHYTESYLDGVLSQVPVFVTEWGVSNSSGNGGDDYTNAQTWLDLLGGNNSANIKVSWCNWSFSDKSESSAALNAGSCGSSNWSSLTTSGSWVKQRISNPADNFGICSTGTTDTTGSSGGNTGGDTTTTTTETPYLGKPIPIPGTVEMEDFDNGGEGVAYHDSDTINQGGAGTRKGGVDIETCSAGGLDIGYTAVGEWLKYTVNVASTGSYKMTAYVASGQTPSGSFHMEEDGNTISGTMSVPETGGWQTWDTISTSVNLTAGTHILRFYVDAIAFNIDKLVFTDASTQSTGAQNGTGTGLLGNYFNGQNFDTAVFNRVDTVIDFNWNSGGPGNGVHNDHFSIRWTGQIEPRYSEQYTFYVTSDDGARLWVNGQELVNDWANHSATTNTGTITLSAGQQYDFKLEYYEATGDAEVILEWSSASQNREVIPKTQLYQPAVVTGVTAPNLYEVSIYPNPADNNLVIKTTGAAHISLINLVGQEVLKSDTRSTQTELNVTELEPGAYVVKIQLKDKALFKTVLIK